MRVYRKRTIKLLTVFCLIITGWQLAALYHSPDYAKWIIGTPVKATPDLNTSDELALTLIPGIGPVLAERIVNFRKKHPINNEQDLLQIKGIGPKKAKRLNLYIKPADREGK